MRKIKYLIKSKDYQNYFLQNNSHATYSFSIGTAILDKKPKYIDSSNELIKSNDPIYSDILFEELNILEKSIALTKERLRHQEENFNLIKDELIRIQNKK